MISLLPTLPYYLISENKKVMNTQFQAPVDIQEESFRNEVGTMDKTGKRKWVFPRKPKGKFTNYRNYTSYVLLGIFFILPFLKINNNPFFLFNILDRHFFIFGQPFIFRTFYSGYRSRNICNICNAFQYCIRKDFLRLALSADYLYGNDIP